MIALVVVLVLAAIAIVAGLGCVFMAAGRRQPPAVDVAAIEREHRRQKAGLRAQLAAKDTEIIRLNAALLAAEQARTHEIVSGEMVPRVEHERVVAELATLRRAWEHGIDFVTKGDRPVVEHRHEEVA